MTVVCRTACGSVRCKTGPQGVGVWLLNFVAVTFVGGRPLKLTDVFLSDGAVSSISIFAVAFRFFLLEWS